MFDFSSVKEVQLSKGAHDSPEKGMCFMEMAAWFAGEEHSDKPACVSPSLGRLGIALNDSMEHDVRDRRLKPMIPHVVGTFDEASEQKRAEYICLRAFNYAAGILCPDFMWSHRGARCYREAAQMAREVANPRRRAYLMSYGSKIDPYSYRMDSSLERLSRTMMAMFEHRPKLSAWVEVVNPSVMSAVTVDMPNDENAGAAGGVFALMGEIIPDWSAGIDTLREAIKLGRHDGFDLAINLEAQHKKLRELVMAE